MPPPIPLEEEIRMFRKMIFWRTTAVWSIIGFGGGRPLRLVSTVMSAQARAENRVLIVWLAGIAIAYLIFS